MKGTTYIKISDFVRKYRYGERIVKYGNIFVTRVVYVAFFMLLTMLLIQKDERMIRVVLVTGVSFILVSIARHFMNAPRPYTLYDFDAIIKKDKVGESMPSRHVFSAFVIGMAFLYTYPVVGIIIFADGILMGFGRVVAGVHFPKDVIAGAIVGILSGVVGFHIILKRLRMSWKSRIDL